VKCKETVSYGHVGNLVQYISSLFALLQCSWPSLSNSVGSSTPVYAVVIADTHLLGSKRGHWLDKLQREWQMYRAFQTSMTLHRPNVVFVLGWYMIFSSQTFNTMQDIYLFQ